MSLRDGLLDRFRRNPKGFVLRLWVYFRRGHSTYLAFLLSFANFIVIQYRLLIESVGIFRLLFASLTAFAATFLLVYVPVATVIGWLDMRKGMLPVEGAIVGEVNPWVRDLLRALYLLAEDRKEEAKKVLEKWVK